MRRALVVALVAMVSISPGAGAKDGDEKKADEGPGMSKPSDQVTVGWVLVQTHEAARLFSPMSARGVTHFYVLTTPGAQFSLDSTESGSIASCTLGVCFQTGDFDVVFFHEKEDGTTQVVDRFTTVGPEAGIVPPNTSFGFVYLKTSGIEPKLRGFEFAYAETVV